jgi:hypothetical protein
VVAQKLADNLKQSFVVENRTGASGTIGAEYTAKSAPDGYTFMVASPAETVVGGFAGLKMNYDWEKDLAPVTVIGETPLAIAIHPSVPVKTIQEFIAYAKKNPGKLSYGTPGSGSSMHFAGESLKAIAASSSCTSLSRRGPAVADLLGGQVPVGIAGLPPVVGPHKAGKMRILAVTSAKRSGAIPTFPRWPSCRASPATTSPTGPASSWRQDAAAVIERLAAEIAKACRIRSQGKAHRRRASIRSACPRRLRQVPRAREGHLLEDRQGAQYQGATTESRQDAPCRRFW